MEKLGLTSKTLLAHLQRVSGRKYGDDQKQAILHGEHPPDCDEGIDRHRSEGDYEQRTLRSQVAKTSRVRHPGRARPGDGAAPRAGLSTPGGEVAYPTGTFRLRTTYTFERNVAG